MLCPTGGRIWRGHRKREARGAFRKRKASHSGARQRMGSKPRNSPVSARTIQADELNEAREQLAATADILKVIAASPSDAVPVFEAIANSANRLIGGFSTAVYRVIDDVVHLVAFTPTDPEADDALKTIFPLHRSQVPSLTMVQNGQTAQIADAEKADTQSRRIAHARGWRSVTFTPLMNGNAFIGFIACTRRRVGILEDHHIQLLRTFADQAVIAIENARLFNETQEALEQQKASSDILRVISRSVADAQPVHLFGSDETAVLLLEGEDNHARRLCRRAAKCCCRHFSGAAGKVSGRPSHSRTARRPLYRRR